MKNPPITAEAIERERYFRLCSEHIKQMERSLSHRYYSPAEKADLETLIDFYTAAREIFRTRGAPSDLGRFPQSAEKPTHSDREWKKVIGPIQERTKSRDTQLVDQLKEHAERMARRGRVHVPQVMGGIHRQMQPGSLLPKSRPSHNIVAAEQAIAQQESSPGVTQLERRKLTDARSMLKSLSRIASSEGKRAASEALQTWTTGTIRLRAILERSWRRRESTI